MSIEEFLNLSKVEEYTNWEEIESKLGFKLHPDIKQFYSKICFNNIKGLVDFSIDKFASDNNKWLNDNGCIGKTEYIIETMQNIDEIKSKVIDAYQTIGEKYGHRLYLGKFLFDIGAISICFNNDNGYIEWIDFDYGDYDTIEEYPHGVLAHSLEKFLNIIKDNTIVKTTAEIVDEYCDKEEVKDALIKYLNGIQSNDKEYVLDVLTEDSDIFEEFCTFLKTGKIVKDDNSISECGYTVYDILDKEPFLPTHTAFMWLSYLRGEEKRENILNNLKNGVPVNMISKLSYNVGRIRDYLLKEKKVTEEVTKQLVKPYYGNPEIANEFAYWLRKREFIGENPVTIHGYTAEILYDKYKEQLDIAGVFSLLISLKGDYEKAIKWINEGFPQK